MPSPFPGMDPFIEARGKWEDFHNKLIGDIERSLASILPSRYTVKLGERSYIEFVDPQWERGGEYLFKAVDMTGLVEVENREVFLEIHELDPQLRLVTGVEILSPSNKRWGSVGWFQYERKRKVFLEGHANLVEIDLLRGGRRHAMAETWPNSPYYVLVLRKENAPRCKVWGIYSRQPLPVIPIPLAPPDADVPLALQPLVNAIYDRSRYGREIDYGKPPLPPLDAEETA